MRVILLGPPGAGKGTQAARLAKRFRVPHVATGDLLRGEVARGTPLGKAARRYMEDGDLVPDDLVLEMIRGRLSAHDAAAGYILDGFPRTERQAEALGDMLEGIGQTLDAVVALSIPDETIVERIAARRSCPVCGRIYHLAANPPREEDRCDDDGEPLILRDDDRPDVVRHRLEVYADRTRPLVEYYRGMGLLTDVDAVGALDTVSERIAAAAGVGTPRGTSPADENTVRPAQGGRR